MSDLKILLLIIVSAITTALLRTLPLFAKIPENNPFINKFFEGLPYAVLTLLVFPGIFTSAGTDVFDIVKVLTGIVIIAYLSFKKYGLGTVISVSMIMIFMFDIVKVFVKF